MLQDALDAVAARAPGRQGLRGALLLKPGRYEVHGSLCVSPNGVLLCGSGDGSDRETSTIPVAKGDTPVRDLTVLHFGHAAVYASGARHITVTDVRATEPVAIRTGGRMYDLMQRATRSASCSRAVMPKMDGTTSSPRAP